MGLEEVCPSTTRSDLPEKPLLLTNISQSWINLVFRSLTCTAALQQQGKDAIRGRYRIDQWPYRAGYPWRVWSQNPSCERLDTPCQKREIAIG
jgi:hypothetical protein